MTQNGPTIDPKFIIRAALIESVCALGGVGGWLLTDNLQWLIGGVLLGATVFGFLVIPELRRVQNERKGRG
jgi:hypothetical protein